MIPTARGSSSSDRAADIPQRLLSADDVAHYLGLGSRYAVYRIVRAGELPGVVVAGKLRLDLRDVDAFIETRKTRGAATAPRMLAAVVSRAPRTHLAPLARKRNGDSPVTPLAKSPSQQAAGSGASDNSSVAPPVAVLR